MSESKDLPPEPWRASNLTPEVEAVITGGKLVCDRLDRPLGIMRPQIAALLLGVPDLLRAAKESLDEFEAWEPGPDEPAFRLIEQLRTAIAKARGGS